MPARDIKGTLFVISGPSGVGKGTLRKELFKKVPELKYSVSCTTRSPREDEVDGVDYFFVDQDIFNKHLSENNFLEWANVHGNLYGTLENTVKELLIEGHDVILEIDVQGAAQVKKRVPDAVLVFIAPPGMEELEKRLEQRGTEDGEDLRMRLENARREMGDSGRYDHIVINNTVEHASDELAEIIRSYRKQTDNISSER